ncbi:MAG: two-component sensor histidine kinase [Pseudonocardiales bacterium]|nr:MAG: two-component sensor histidine kinase [Pseudonocardiales bacterium]
MTVLLVGIGVITYVSVANSLLDEIDAGLRFRAAATIGASRAGTIRTPDPQLQEPGEAFAQLLTSSGRVLSTSPGFDAPLLRADQLAGIQKPTFFQRHLTKVAGTARLLAVPFAGSTAPVILVVGTTMADRADALHRLAGVFVIGGPSAIALACLAGWFVAGSALRPVERMRRQASAITVSGLDRRLTVPTARDELQLLARTLNDMLERLDHSLVRERAFLERASHELRTPLAALRAEVDLSLRRRRSAEELTSALHSVSQETDRLARLAEDLLVLARADNGRLPLRREDISLRDTLGSAAALFAARAAQLAVTLSVDAPNLRLSADPLRLRQALVNLLDNALRHTPRHGAVLLTGTIGQGEARILVSDTGPGFAGPLPSPEHYEGELASGAGPAGLGLRIVHAVAASHRGTVRIWRNDAGGASVELTLSLAFEPHSVAVSRH